MKMARLRVTPSCRSCSSVAALIPEDRRADTRTLHVNFSMGASVLHTLRSEFGFKASLYGVSPDKSVVSEARRKHPHLNLLHLGASERPPRGATPFRDGFFDLVIVSVITSSLKKAHQKGLFAEIVRILAAGGRVVVLDAAATGAGAADTGTDTDTGSRLGTDDSPAEDRAVVRQAGPVAAPLADPELQSTRELLAALFHPLGGDDDEGDHGVGSVLNAHSSRPFIFCGRKPEEEAMKRWASASPHADHADEDDLREVQVQATIATAAGMLNGGEPQQRPRQQQRRRRRQLRTVCVFSSVRGGGRPGYESAAAALGAEMSRRGISLLHGGGTSGLMGAIAKAIEAGGGTVTGVIPRALQHVSAKGPTVGQTHFVANMEQRKAFLYPRADAFVILPGGMGTLAELTEVLCEHQLGVHAVPVGCLNACGAFDGLLSYLDASIREGLVKPIYRHILQVASDPAALLDLLEAYRPVPGYVAWKKPQGGAGAGAAAAGGAGAGAAGAGLQQQQQQQQQPPPPPNAGQVEEQEVVAEAAAAPGPRVKLSS